jgi:tRNA pseudouridine38-40 synthase
LTRTIRATVAYDGTDFAGWQIQNAPRIPAPHTHQPRTVQGVFEQALARMHGHRVPVTAAGRTDAGVHAVGQVASFRTAIDSLTPAVLPRALNSYLPDDVRVVDAQEADAGFDARRSALLRMYRYQLLPGRQLPHLRRYTLWVRRPLRLEMLNRMASATVGEHDFTTFAAAGAVGSSFRRVVQASFFADGPLIVFRIAAQSFLWKMVRSLVGTMLALEAECGADAAAPQARMAELIRDPSRERVGQTAPAWGLFLERVCYAGDPPLVGALPYDRERAPER